MHTASLRAKNAIHFRSKSERLDICGKMKYAIHKFHSFKSTVLDEVFPALLKEGEKLLIDKLGSIFNLCLEMKECFLFLIIIYCWIFVLEFLDIN